MFSFLLLFLVLGSLLDILMNSQRGTVDNNNNVSPVLNSKIFKVLLCFSVYTNGKKILNTKTASDNMGALHGIRFLSMTWVLLGHTYGFLNFQAIENVADAAEITTNFAFLAVSNATVSVDTFFFLSGFLVAYVTLKTMKKKDGHLSLPLYYFHRFWRLTPPYAFVIAFTVVWRIMSRGPFWDEMVIVQAENCRKNWWATLLYVSNFVNSEEICLGHGWYLSNDMQFYVLTPLIIIPLYKWPVAGLVINFLFLLTATITPGVLNSMNNFPPNGVIGQDVKRMMEQFRMIYVKPYCRMGPYCVGIFAAYLLLKHRNMKIKPVFQVIGWCLAIACNLSVIYGIYPWNKGNLPSNEVAALYTATHRTAWSLGIAWLTVACVTGHGGPVNALLSWKAFIPLGRLSYLSYLSHPLVMYYNFGRHRGNFYFSHYNTVYLFLSYLVLSLAVAFIASVAVEGPFMALEKVILPGERKTKTEKTAPTENGKDSNGNVAVMITNEEKPGVDNPTFTKDNHNTYM
ncbi:nose resistant to fluoxetine protein 6-like [Tachypleus tridentatus]|uniref:nose resistant to fluoxetine protein 6-like n=1 Tax=Tachypleus tridentatus TaxID=6853 RepID=UPI003FD0CDCE